MRLIDADALEKDYRIQFERVYKSVRDSVKPSDYFIERKAAYDKELIRLGMEAFCEFLQSRPTIDAEPVRHGETTSYISTDDIDKYKSRIILDEGGKSKWCRVFYEDDRQHGVWVNPHMNKYGHPCHHCSECGFLASQKDRNYCPNCGAKMDGGAEG